MCQLRLKGKDQRMCNTLQLGLPCPELNPFPGSQATLNEVWKRNMQRWGIVGKESPTSSACLGAEAIGKRVDFSLFFSSVNYIEAAY